MRFILYCSLLVFIVVEMLKLARENALQHGDTSSRRDRRLLSLPLVTKRYVQVNEEFLPFKNISSYSFD